MARAGRTFRTQPAKKIDWTNPSVVKEFYEAEANEKTKLLPLKDSRIQYQILFDDDKLLTYYTATMMMGSFFKESVPMRYDINDRLVIDDRAIKTVFNTADAIIKYFKLRYSRHPELIKQFIEARVYLTPYSNMTLMVDNYYSRMKMEKETGVPAGWSREFLIYLDNWETLDKMVQELTCIQRVGSPTAISLLYQILHYYYYNDLMDIPEEPIPF